MLNGIRSLMSQNNIDWFVVFSEDPHLSEYTGECDKYREVLSHFTGSAGVLVAGGDEAYLWTDSRYYIQAERELSGSGIELKKSGLSGVESWDDFLSEHVWDGQVIAFDYMTISYRDYKELRRKIPESVTITDGGALLAEAAGNMPKRNFCEIVAAPLKFTGRSAAEKLAALREHIEKSLARDKSYTYIISDLTSVMWLFNLRGSDIEYVPVAYSYAAVTAYSATLYASLKHMPQSVRSHLSDNGVLVKEYSLFYQELCDIATDVVIADPYANNCRIIADYDERGMFIPCNDPELIRKSVKSPSEIEGMKSAHIKDAVTMIRFIKKVKELAEKDNLGDEYTLGHMLDDMRLFGGCSSLSFDTICAYGKNAAIVHYSAKKDTAAKIAPKGFLLVDSGGQYRFEGTTDITRTIPLGDVTDEEKKIYTTVLQGNLRLMDMIFPEGCKGSLIDGAAEEPIWKIGEYCGHGIGHGVGSYLSVHESEARISRNSNEREVGFEPGVIVSDEPGIYLENRFGVRLENLLLTERADERRGYKMCRFTPLTLVPFDRDAIDFSLMSDKEKAVLSHYNSMIEDVIFPYLEDDEREWTAGYMKF